MLQLAELRRRLVRPQEDSAERDPAEPDVVDGADPVSDTEKDVMAEHLERFIRAEPE